MKSLPLIFNFKKLVFGRTFVAGVAMTGRALLEEEDGEEWISGVRPVGLAGGGADRSTAFHEFRKAWCQILFDIAAEAADFESFRSEVEAFLGGEQEQMSTLWDDAHSKVRSSLAVEEDLDRVRPEDCPVGFRVDRLRHEDLGPTANEFVEELHPAA